MQKIRQQGLFELIHGGSRLARELGQSDPDQDSACNGVTLDSRLSALALFNARQLFDLAVKLLNLPALGTRIWCGLVGVFAHVVGCYKVRAEGGHRNPVQLHLVILGKAVDLDHLAVCQVVWRPLQRVGTAILALALHVIKLGLVLERAVVNLAQRLQLQHQLLADIPAIDQHSVEGGRLGGN